LLAKGFFSECPFWWRKNRPLGQKQNPEQFLFVGGGLKQPKKQTLLFELKASIVASYSWIIVFFLGGEESFVRRVKDETKEEKLFFALFFTFVPVNGNSVGEDPKNNQPARQLKWSRKEERGLV
jgi:hypothetical protein